jgi:hypothetical protein
MAAPRSKHASGRLLAALDEMDLRALSRSLSDELRERSVTFGGADGSGICSPRASRSAPQRSSASSPMSTASAGS